MIVTRKLINYFNEFVDFFMKIAYVKVTVCLIFVYNEIPKFFDFLFEKLLIDVVLSE